MDPALRLLPERPLPPYTYVPGRNPHPVRDPGGHLHGRPPEAPPAPDPARWRASAPYLYGIDLYNRGYYWEAHEAWESLWHACGRNGPTADFLRALIRLAAAGFKVREGRPNGCLRHAAAAAGILGGLAAEAGQRFMGLDLAALADQAAAIARGEPGAMAAPAALGPVFARSLVPADPCPPSGGPCGDIPGTPAGEPPS
jgi:hypothetical protein